MHGIGAYVTAVGTQEEEFEQEVISMVGEATVAIYAAEMGVGSGWAAYTRYGQILPDGS